MGRYELLASLPHHNPNCCRKNMFIPQGSHKSGSSVDNPSQLVDYDSIETVRV